MSKVISLAFSNDAVNINFMLKDTASLGENSVFNGAGRRITNVEDGIAGSDKFYAREIYDLS